MASQTVSNDLQRALSLFNDIQYKSKDVNQHVSNLLKKAKAQEFATTNGISFLEVKYQLLLSYLINLVYTLLQKSRGQSIDRDASVDRMVEIRTVLEKMRPIDQKLKYQIDKVIKTASTGGVSGTNSTDPLRFRANPDNMVNKLEGESSDSEDSDDDRKAKEPKNKSGLYVAPKLSAVHYDGDDSIKDRQTQVMEKAKKKALSSSILKELRDEYYEGPEEIRESRDLHRFREDKRAKERTLYEEDNFIRMTLSKKEKMSSQKMSTMSGLNTLTQFDDISALTGEGGDGMSNMLGASKKRKGSKGKGKKKGSKKRKRH